MRPNDQVARAQGRRCPDAWAVPAVAVMGLLLPSGRLRCWIGRVFASIVADALRRRYAAEHNLQPRCVWLPRGSISPAKEANFLRSVDGR